jgi:hypothetical protein
MEGDSCNLITQKQLFDFVRGVSTVMEAESRCSRLRTSPTNTGSKTSLKVSRARVAEDLTVVWWIAIDEFDGEAELVCIEFAGTLDVRNEELCRD